MYAISLFVLLVVGAILRPKRRQRQNDSLGASREIARFQRNLPRV